VEKDNERLPEPGDELAVGVSDYELTPAEQQEFAELAARNQAALDYVTQAREAGIPVRCRAEGL
jgi:hypothetical protein